MCIFLRSHPIYSSDSFLNGKAAVCPKVKHNYFATFFKQCNETSHMLTLEDRILLHELRNQTLWCSSKQAH